MGLRVYLDLYVPDFPKSTSKYLFCTKVVTKHGFRCFTAMCTFWLNWFFLSLHLMYLIVTLYLR